MVSNFVKIIPSIPLRFWEKSRSDWSNLDSWSTASLPTRASPTKTILSGLLTVTSCHQREAIGEPHLSKSSHQRLIVLHSSRRIDQYNIKIVGFGCNEHKDFLLGSPYAIASFAIPAASLP